MAPGDNEERDNKPVDHESQTSTQTPFVDRPLGDDAKPKHIKIHSTFDGGAIAGLHFTETNWMAKVMQDESGNNGVGSNIRFIVQRLIRPAQSNVFLLVSYDFRQEGIIVSGLQFNFTDLVLVIDLMAR